MQTTIDPEVRFRRNVRAAASGCHLWIGTFNADGYGKFVVGCKQMLAHRVACEMARQESIPKGMVVAHQCNVRACVNPEHLVVQTQRENILYSYQRQERGRRGGSRAKLWRRPPPIEVPTLLPGVEVRFWSKVGPETEAGCRLWLAGAPEKTGGYGRFSVTSALTLPAHRIAAQLYAKRVILPNEVVRHACRNRRCVAQAHLIIGSQKENIADAIEAGTHNSVRQSKAKLTFEVAEEVRRKHREEGRSQLSLAKELGVSQTTVWKVLNNMIWASRVWARDAWREEAKKDTGPVERSVPSRKSPWPRSSGKIDWETPPEFFAEVSKKYNFTLDVCAKPTNAKCSRYFSPAVDGLTQEWTGVCWMNPPYGRGIDKWLDKARESALAGATVVCLIPAYTGTKWWHRCVLGVASEVTYIDRKLTFVGARYPASFASALVVFRPPEK